MTRTRYADIPAYITQDDSEVREVMHPSVHGNRRRGRCENRGFPDDRMRAQEGEAAYNPVGLY